jgi:acylphosphatase
MKNENLRAVILGRVQGVNFRAFTRQKALELGLKGFTCNLPSGHAVEV